MTIDDENALCKPEDLRVWIEENQPTIRRHAKRWQQYLKLPYDLIDDITNEIVLVILETEKSAIAFDGWLAASARTAANRVAERHGRSRPGRKRLDGFDTPVALQLVPDHKSMHPGFMAVDFADAISSIDDRMRLALRQHFFDGQTQVEIAKEWGWSRQRFNRFISFAVTSLRLAMAWKEDFSSIAL